jgi:pyruvate/2-oxoglutarate dehydrogenase complex dihydrolipoamide acyltransferase (E2) component
MKSSKKRTGLLVLTALPLTAGLVLAAGTAAQTPQTQTPQTQTPRVQVPQRLQPAQPGSDQARPRQQSGKNYADVFLQKLAQQLGVSVERLKVAAVQAGSATIDQGVQAGDIRSDRAAALKERLQNAPLNFGFRGQGGRRGPGGHDQGGPGRMDGGPRGFDHQRGDPQNRQDSPGGQSADTTGT